MLCEVNSFFSSEFGSTFTVAGSPIGPHNVMQSMILYFLGGLLEIFINDLVGMSDICLLVP